ncbi:T9SS type A sorting domain-containing protein, partial [bacterium]|nr:T9SS type A sorting domain-containing protein [bacterium]
KEIPDSYAADGDGLAGLIQLRTTSEFSVTDEAKIYIKKAVFSDNSYPNRIEEYSIQSYSVGGRINPDDSPKETGELIEDIIRSNTDTITAEYGDGTKISLNFTSGSGFAGNTVTINALGDSLPDSLASDEGFMKISEKAAAYFLIETDIDTSVNPFTADLSFTYTTENLSSAGIIEGSAEESRLVMAFFNENNVWQKVETVIDTNSNTVSAEVSHFSSWAIVDSSDSDLVPVDLSVFTVKIDEYEGIILEWSTISESNNYGFYIEKSTDNIIFAEIGFVSGAGTSFKENAYSYVDMDNNEAGDYYYRLRQTDYSGDYTYSGIIKITIKPPGDYELFPAYPNPFNPTATIEYSLKEVGFVKLAVYNTLGQEVAGLVNDNMAAGKHKVLFNAGNLAAGMYIYKITVNGFTSAGKIVLMK